MSLRKKAAQGVLWSVIQRWGREGISFLVLAVLSRLLAPEAFGLVAMAFVFTDFAHVFMDQGFTAAIVQRDGLEKAHLDTAFWISVSTGFVFTLGGIAGSELIAALFHEPQLGPVVRWLSPIFLLYALSSTQMAILQRELAFKSLALRSLAAKTVGGIVGVALAFQGFGVWSLVAQRLAGGAVGVVVLWRASDWRPGFKVSLSHYNELFRFGIAVVGNNLLKTFTRRADHFVIGYFLGPTLLGFYTVGYRLLWVIMRVVTGIINAVAFPAFSRLQGDPERMRRAFYKVTQYTSLLSFPVFLGVAVLAPEVVPAVFGEKWAASVPVLQVLAFTGVLESVSVFNGTVMRASGRPAWQFGITLLTAMCSLIGYVIAVRWGIVAVAASFVIVSYLLAPISYVAVRRLIQIDLRTYAGQFALPGVASLLMVLGILALKGTVGHQALSVYLELPLYTAVGGLIYLLVLTFTARTLSRQLWQMISLALPSWKFRRT
jgi:PST family polysaccharide transporter